MNISKIKREMKRYVLLCVLLGWIFVNCDDKTGFVIIGTINDTKNQEVYLIAKNLEERWDTLTKAIVQDGVFELRGKVEQPLIAYLSGSDKFVPLLVFLENKEYCVDVNKQDARLSKVVGGLQQELYNEYKKQKNLLEQEMQMLRDTFRLLQKNECWKYSEKVKKKWKQMDSVGKSIDKQFIKQYGDILPAVYVLYKRSENARFERLCPLFVLLSEDMKKTPYGKVIVERYENSKITAIGEIAPDFKLQSQMGDTFSLYGIKAKVKVLEFWASWCAPCREESFNLKSLYSKYQKEGLEILSVSLDIKREAWVKAIREDSLTWMHVSDLNGWECIAAQLYKIHMIPSIFVLDENNMIVGNYLRGEDVEKCVKKVLNMNN